MASLIMYRLVSHQYINKPNMYYPNWRWPNQNNQFYTATTSFPLLSKDKQHIEQVRHHRASVVAAAFGCQIDSSQIFQESPQELKNL